MKTYPFCYSAVLFAVLAGFPAPLGLAQDSANERSSIEIDAERATSSLRPSDGFLTEWQVAGPFPFNAKLASAPDAARLDEDADLVKLAGAKAYWEWHILGRDDTRLDLLSLFEGNPRGIVFARAEVYVNRDMSIRLLVDSPQPFECWLNGESLAFGARGDEAGRARTANTRIRMGFNEVLIATRRDKGAWGLTARVLSSDGQTLDPARLWIMDDQAQLAATTFELKFRQPAPGSVSAPRLLRVPPVDSEDSPPGPAGLESPRRR